MAEEIRLATTADDFTAFAGLVTDYIAWCRVRYQHDVAFIDEVFGHQSLAAELSGLAAMYAAPNGRTLLACRDGVAVGGVAYRRLPDGSCEMKRLFVAEGGKGQGTGRKLCQALIAAARADGCAVMRLDTGKLFTEAIAMYLTLGFRHCAPHHHYPAPLMEHLVFMELPLIDVAARSHDHG